MMLADWWRSPLRALLVGASLALVGSPGLAAAPETGDRETGEIFPVPIRSVAVDRQAAEWELWIAGDRLSACNLPLHVTETAVPIAEREGAIAIRIRLVHHLPADGTCREESVPFALDLKIEERLRPGIDYQIAVNDYTFSLFIQPENAP